MVADVIDGVTFHPRSTWESPTQPVVWPGVYVPPPHALSLVDTYVFHYTAALDLPDGDPGENADDVPGYLRAINADYYRRHGFSIGYSFALDWLGGVWELRGYTWRPAATGGKLTGRQTFNRYTLAVLCLVDGSDALTPDAAAAARRLVADAERRCGRQLELGPHSRYDRTACCGDGIRAQLAAGLLDPDPVPTPFPWEDSTVTFLFRVRGYSDVLLLDHGHVVPMSAELIDAARAGGLPAPAVIPPHKQFMAWLTAQLPYALTPSPGGV